MPNAVMESSFVADCGLGNPPSIARTVNVEVPAKNAEPVICPVAAFRVSPAGRLPGPIDQEWGVVPPVTGSVNEYGEPTTALGVKKNPNARGAGAILMDSALVTGGKG